MAEIDVIDKKNNKLKTKKININKKVSQKDTSDYLKHSLNRYVNNRFRYSKASTKGRSEIAVTGAKAYRQKGTGNARRGVNSSPVRRGGAVAFGPKPRFYKFKLNKKAIKVSQSMIYEELSKKMKIISNDIDITKTKEAVNFIKQFKCKRITLLITYNDLNFIKPFRNIKNLMIDFIDYAEPEMLLVSDLILYSESSFAKIEERR